MVLINRKAIWLQLPAVTDVFVGRKASEPFGKVIGYEQSLAGDGQTCGGGPGLPFTPSTWRISRMHGRPTRPTGTPRQDRQSWSRWPIAWSVTFATVLGFTLLSPSTVLARTFQCRAMDVACLIASIAQANAQPGNSHEIRLAAGIYTLTAADNSIDGPNGLPSVTSPSPYEGRGRTSPSLSGTAMRPHFVCST